MTTDTTSVNQYEARFLPLLDASLEKYKQGDLKPLRDILAILNTHNIVGLLTMLHCMRKRVTVLAKTDIYTELQSFRCWNDVKVVENFLLFLFDFVSADGRVVGSVFGILISVLKNSQLCSPTPTHQIPDQNLNLLYQSFQKLITLVPRGYSLLWNELLFHSPHHEREFDRVIGYMKILMQISQLCPLLRDRIIAFLVEKAIHLDVEIKLEDLDEEEQIDDQFELERDNKAQQVKTRMRQSADKLDAIMLILFHDISNQNSQEDKQSLDETFRLYLKIFDAVILLTHHCKIVQFLVFYICSLQKVYAVDFVHYLLAKFDLTTNTLLIRCSAISYLGSFVARANYLKVKTIKNSLVFVSTWIKRYIESEENETPLEGDDRRLFYTAATNLFYIVCYQHWKLFKKHPTKALVFCKQLDFEKIVTSSLNPLHNCTAHVAGEFVKVCKNRNIGNWSSIMYRNKKLLKNSLHEYFPFDPYLLKNSSEFITPQYNSWKDITEDDDEDDEDDDNNEHEQEEEEEEEDAGYDSEIPKAMSYEDLSYDLEYQFGYH
jgi:RNA polymerase I-specific transcription initiation factor RRN3